MTARITTTSNASKIAPFLILLASLALVGCEVPRSAGPSHRTTPFEPGAGSGLARYKARKLAEISPYAEGRRWESYFVIDDLFDRLWNQSRSSTTIASGTFDTFRNYPSLTLEDRDNDGDPEFFAYMPRKTSEDTQEFGAFFDLSGDGQTDWIVFYGGVLPTKGFKMVWWNHHAIDRNSDGDFDVYVMDAVDTNGDGSVEEGATVWIYDDNFDGLIDRGEHIIDGRVEAIAEKNGTLDWGNLLRKEPQERPRVGDPIPTKLFDAVPVIFVH